MKKNLLVIVVLSLSLIGCGAKNQTTKVSNDISKIDVANTYQLKDVSIDNGKLTGKVSNDDDFKRDLTLSVKLLSDDKEVYTEEFIVKSIDVGEMKTFDFKVDSVKYDDLKVEIVNTEYVEK